MQHALTKSLLEKKTEIEWLTTGTTSLLPKSKETTKPYKYRQICCLPMTYILLAGIVTDSIYDHLERDYILKKSKKAAGEIGKELKINSS